MGKGGRKGSKKAKDSQQAAKKENASSASTQESGARLESDRAKPTAPATETATPPARDSSHNGDNDAPVNSIKAGVSSDSSASTIPPATGTTMDDFQDGAQPDFPDRKIDSETSPRSTTGNVGESVSNDMSASRDDNALLDEYAKLHVRFDKLQRDKDELQRSYDTCYDDAVQVQEQKEKLEKQLEEVYRKTNVDNIFKHGTIEEMKRELEINSKELAEANSAREKTEKERNKWQEMFNARNERFKDLETYGENVNDEIRREKKRNVQLARDYDERTAESAAQREELQRLQRQLQEAEKQAAETEQYASAFELITAELQPILDDAGLDATADSIISLMTSMSDSAKLKRTSSDASMGSDISVRKPRLTNGKRKASLGDELRTSQRKDSGQDNDSEDNFDAYDQDDEMGDLWGEKTPRPNAPNPSELQAERAKTMKGFHLPAHSQRDQELYKLKEEVRSRDEELVKLKEEHWERDEELGKLKNEIWERDEELERLKKEVWELGKKLDDMTTRCEEADEKKVFLDKQIGELDKQLKETEDKFNARNHDTMILEQELGRTGHGRSLSLMGELRFEKKAREEAEQKLAKTSAAAQQNVKRFSTHDQAAMAWWMKVLWILSFILSISLGYAGYREAKMWYDANDVSLDVHPYAQLDGSSGFTYSSKYANNPWVRWIEDDVLGFSQQLYG